jgi:hypothetical protein
MISYKDKIIFRYPADSKPLLPTVYTKFDGSSVLVDESYIKSRLLAIFDQATISIEEIIVTLEVMRGKSGNHFGCELSIVSPEIDFNLKETGSDFDDLVHQVIDKAIEYVHKEKAKKLSNS